MVTSVIWVFSASSVYIHVCHYKKNNILFSRKKKMWGEQKKQLLSLHHTHSALYILYMTPRTRYKIVWYWYGGGTDFRSPNIKICFETFHRIKNFNWPFRAFTLISYKLIFSLKCSFEHMFIYFVYSSLTSWLMLSNYVRHVFSITPKEFQIDKVEVLKEHMCACVYNFGLLPHLTNL